MEGAVKYASLRIDIVHWVTSDSAVLPDQTRTHRSGHHYKSAAQQPLSMIIKAAAPLLLLHPG